MIDTRARLINALLGGPEPEPWQVPVNTLMGTVGPPPPPHVPHRTPSEEGVGDWLRRWGAPRPVAEVGGAAAALSPWGAAYDIGREWIGPAIEERNALLGGAGLAMAALPLPARRLPMDAASVAARRRSMGYSETPFWRGDAGTAVEYPSGGFFSRDPHLATGHAARHQAESDAAPREFRLDLQSSFDFNRPLTEEQGSRLVAAVAAFDPRLAAGIRGTIDDGASTALVWHALERNIGNPKEILRRAGFTSVDTGRDVMMLSGSGIRSADAVFDPDRAHLPNIYYGLPFAALTPWALADDRR
jgi:hypothetical protein